MSTRQKIIKEVVDEAVKGFRETLIQDEKDRVLEKAGEKASEIKKQQYLAFIAKFGKEAYYDLYKEPYAINIGTSFVGRKEIQVCNERTGLVLASAGSEAVALKRFEKLAQEKREGRPVEMVGGKACNVYLDSESIAVAKYIGKGSISEGIRLALKQYPQE